MHVLVPTVLRWGMDEQNDVPTRKSAPGREKELTQAQRQCVRELSLKGQRTEELAVGFGVSFNTIRNVLKESENLAESPAES